MNLGELIVELSLDSNQFNAELDKVKSHSTTAIKNLEKTLNKGFNLKINASSLDKFNKSLDNVLQKFNNINQHFKSNPIVVGVDKTQLDELNKALNTTKRKVNIQTELSGASKQESRKVGEDIADGFVEGTKTIKSKKKAIVDDFRSIIDDVKGVFEISSPSKVMEMIGLDVGKGFQDGVIASMLLASKRISESYEKTLDKIIKNPKATQAQKQTAQNLKGEVQKELEFYAKLMREDRMPFPQEQRDEAKKILDKAQQNAKKVGIKSDEIKSIAQSAKKEAENIINPPKAKSDVSSYEEFKKEFLLVFHELLKPGESDVRIYELRRELDKRGKVTNRKAFDSYYLDLLNDEELNSYHYNGEMRRDFVDRTKHPVGKPLGDYFAYNEEEFLKALEDSFFPMGADVPKTFIKLGESFDLDEYVAKNKPQSKPEIKPEIKQEVKPQSKPKPEAKPEVKQEIPKIIQESVQVAVKQAEIANRTIEDIFKDISAISKDAVTILQKYGTDISAIPARNTKQIKEVSKTELSGLIKELESMGFEVAKATKSTKAKTAKTQKVDALEAQPIKEEIKQSPVQPVKEKIESAKTASRTIEDIFKDITAISKDAVTILQKYGADISAIPARNTKQIKEVSKSELSGLIKELQSMGFEVVKATKSTKAKASKTNNIAAPVTAVQENVAEQAKAANRIVEDIFKDIATISKDAVTILQKYGTDISAIPARNTKQIKEVSRAELSGLIQELKSAGFEVTKSTKTSKSTKVKTDKTGIEKEFYDMGANSINAFASGVEKQSKASRSRVKKTFDGIVTDVKNTLQIQSPSKLMQSVGLNFGKGFESGAIASLTLSSKRISDAYKDIVNKIINDPSVSQAQKQALAASKNQIDADLQKFANDYSKGKFGSEADAMKRLGQIYKDAKTKAENINKVSSQDQIDVVEINKGVRQDIQEAQEENYGKILGNLFDSFAKQDLGRFVMNLEKAFEPFQDFITFDIGNLFEYFQGMVDMAIQSLQQLTGMMVQVESIQKKLDYLGGSKAGGAREMTFALETANEFRVPAEAAANAYAQLSLAAKGTKLEGRGVQNLFKGISASLSALGLSGQDAELAFMAYTQMLSKGKISMEELRQQLSERFPPAMGIFSKALNVTTGELNNLASQGALLSDVTLSKVADTLLAEYGGAAKGMQGVGMSLTAIGNSMFTIAVKMTNAFSGLFSGVIDIFGGIVKTIENSFDSIVKIAGLAAGAMLVAISGTLLGMLSKIPILQTALVSFVGLAKTTLLSGFGLIVAGIPGIIAVFLDGFLSAEDNIAGTITKSVKNFLAFIGQMVDGVKRKLTGTGLFEINIGRQTSNPFQGMIDSASKLFNMIPKGLIQMAALIAIFHQLRGLTMSAGLFNAIGPALTAVKSLATSFFASMSAGFMGLKAGAVSFGSTLLASVGTALKSLAALGVQAILALGVMTLAKSDFSNPMQDAVNTMASNVNNSLNTIEQSFKSIETSVNNTAKSTGNLATGVKSVVDAIPSKGLQLDIMYVLGFKSKGYTTDDQIKDINRALANQNPDGLGVREQSAYNMQMAKLSIEARAKNIAELRKQQDEARSKGNQELVDSIESRIQNNYSFSPFVNRGIDKLLNSPVVMQSQEFRDKIAKQEAERFKSLGLSKDQIKAANTYFKGTDIVRSTDSKVAEGVKQALDMGVLLSKRLEETKNAVKNMGLDSPDKFLKTAGGATKKTIDEIKLIDQKIAGLGMERVKAVTNNDLARITEIDKQIRSLQTTREGKTQAFKDQLTAAQAISKEADAFAQKLEELGIPISGELRKAIDEMKALGKQAENTIKQSVPINVMDDLYQKTKTALTKFQSAYDKFSNNIEIASAQRTASIYTPGASQGDVSVLSQQSDIVALQQQVLAARAKLSISSQSLQLMSAIPSQTAEQTQEVEDLKLTVRDDALNLATNEASLQKAKYDIQQTIKDFNDQIEDYVKNITREIKTIELDTKKANLQMQQQKFSANFRSALFNIIDTELTSLSNAFENFITTLNDAAMSRLNEEQIGIDLQNKLDSLDDGYENLIENMPTGRQLQGLEQARIDTLKMLSVYDESNSKIQETIKGAETQAGSLNKQVNNVVNSSSKISPNLDKAAASTVNFTEEMKRAADTAEQLALSTNQLANANATTYSNAMSANTGANAQPSSTSATNNNQSSSQSSQNQPRNTTGGLLGGIDNILKGWGLPGLTTQRPASRRPPQQPSANSSSIIGLRIEDVRGTGVNTAPASDATGAAKKAETERANARRLAERQNRANTIIKGVNQSTLDLEKMQRDSNTDDVSRLDKFYQIMREVGKDVEITESTKRQIYPLSRIYQNARRTLESYTQMEAGLLQERNDISRQLREIPKQFEKLKKIIDTEISATTDPEIKRQLQDAKQRFQIAFDEAVESQKARLDEINQQLAKMEGAGLTTREKDKQGNIIKIKPTEALNNLFNSIVETEKQLEEKQEEIEKLTNQISSLQIATEKDDLSLQLNPGLVLDEIRREEIVSSKNALLQDQAELQYLQKEISIGQQYLQDKDLIKYNRSMAEAKRQYDKALANIVEQKGIIARDLDRTAEDLREAAKILNEDLDTTGTYARKRLDIQRNLDSTIKTIENTQFDADPTKNKEQREAAAQKAAQRALEQNEELDKEIRDNLLSRNPLLEMEIQRLQRGNADPFVVNRMQRDLARSKWADEYGKRKEDIEKDQDLNEEQRKEALGILNEINTAKLREIADSFRTFGQALADSAIATGLQTLKDELTGLVMNDLIIGFDGATGKTRDLSNELKGFERVLYNVTKAVLNAMTKILIEAAVNKLFGKGGWLDIGKAFGLAKGGIVPNYAEGGSVDGIGKAIQKERSQNGGIDPVLAVLTPGERVLTVAENRKFEALKLQRFLEPIAIMPEEMAYRKIQNYAMGGVVGSSADSSIQINNTYAKEQPSNSTTINVPVTVENNGNSNDSQIDANSLQNAVRSAVLTEIQRQQRIGGILRK